MNKILVVILNIETKEIDDNIYKLKNKVFSSSLFHTVVFKDVYPYEINNKEKHSDYIKRKENYLMLRALKFSKKYLDNRENSYNNFPVIIVKDSSFTHLNSFCMTEKIKESLKYINEFDLLFLCKWNDKCYQYKNLKDSKQLYWSKNPSSTQCVMYTPKARDDFIEYLQKEKEYLGDMFNNKIKEKKIKAVVFSPNIVDFDINLTTKDAYYKKTHSCVLKSKIKDEETNEGTWIIAILIILLLIFIYILYSFLI
jgi:hypothetical protein